MTADLERQLRTYCQTIDEAQGRLTVDEVLERTGHLQMVPPPHSIRATGRRTWVGALVAVVVVLLIFSGIWLLPHGEKTPIQPANPVPVATTLGNPVGSSHNGAIITSLIGSGIATVIRPPGGRQTVLRLPELGMGGGPSIAWSPDGRHLAVFGDRFAIVDSSDATSTFVELDEKVACTCSLDWSSDGSAIVIGDSHGNVHIVTTDDWKLSPISPDPARLGIQMFSPSWSPDGEWIAFSTGNWFAPSSGDVESGEGIYKIRRDGSDLTLLAGGITGVVEWSPTDNRIAVLASELAHPGSIESDIIQLSLWMVDGDSHTKEVRDSLGRCFCLNFRYGLEWAPDGTVLALNIPNPDLSGAAVAATDWGVYLIDPDGQNLRLLGEAGAGDPAWQPIPPARANRSQP